MGEERVLEIFVERENNHSTTGVCIEHLQAVEVCGEPPVAAFEGQHGER